MPALDVQRPGAAAAVGPDVERHGTQAGTPAGAAAPAGPPLAGLGSLRPSQCQGRVTVGVGPNGTEWGQVRPQARAGAAEWDRMGPSGAT